MKLKLLAAALLATGVVQAATPIDGWYNSVFGGYTYFNPNINRTLGIFNYNNVAYNQGYNVGGRVGYQNHPLRYELEYTYLGGSTSSFAIDFLPQRDVSGSISGNIFMANIYYDFPDMLPAIAPFLGVGIGVAVLRDSLVSRHPFHGAYLRVSDDLFSYQATIGFTYNFAESYAVNVAYRFIAAGEAGNFGRVFQANLASVGAVYRFDQPLYK